MQLACAGETPEPYIWRGSSATETATPIKQLKATSLADMQLACAGETPEPYIWRGSPTAATEAATPIKQLKATSLSPTVTSPLPTHTHLSLSAETSSSCPTHQQEGEGGGGGGEGQEGGEIKRQGGAGCAQVREQLGTEMKRVAGRIKSVLQGKLS